MYNPGFEEYYHCPDNFNIEGDEEMVPGWSIPSKGTSDYFNRCDKTKRAGVPHNKMGHLEAKEGDGYAGIILYSGGERKEAYREYLQNHLTRSLEAGKIYCVKFYYAVASNSAYSVNRLGLTFSNSKLATKDMVLKMHPDIEISAATQEIRKDYWIEFCGTYKASGDEKYVLIGNFYDDKQTQTYDFREHKDYSRKTRMLDYAYYYVDMVSITEKSRDEICCPQLEVNYFPGPDTLMQNESYVFKNIYFDFDHSSLRKKSYQTLQALVDILDRNLGASIEITGHTDSVGSDAYNNKLSLKRAKTVAEYLEMHCDGSIKITYQGYGEEVPIATNANAEGRAQNRRVEFKILYP